MSGHIEERRTNIQDISGLKGIRPVVSLTAYSAPTARILDAHVDMILVGDSLGMVIYGMETTVGVTLDMMISHGSAVVRATEKACVIVDLPFGSYQESPEVAFKSAARVLGATGCNGVKLEGGVEMAETVRFLTSRGIPVLGHVGLMPQSYHLSSGYRIQGKTKLEAEKIFEDAMCVQEGGAFAVVLEGIPADLAQKITKSLDIPTIGIGAGPFCDGQIQVYHDILGLYMDLTPKHSKCFGNIKMDIQNKLVEYKKSVENGKFPEKSNYIINKRNPIKSH